MQRGLIDHRAGQERLAVGFQRERRALKPVRPLRMEMPLDPNEIDDWCIRVPLSVVRVHHAPALSGAGRTRLCRLLHLQAA